MVRFTLLSLSDKAFCFPGDSRNNAGGGKDGLHISRGVQAGVLVGESIRFGIVAPRSVNKGKVAVTNLW